MLFLPQPWNTVTTSKGRTTASKATMVVQFCKSCGNLLDDSFNEILECEMCGRKAKNTSLNHTQTLTSENFPSRLRNKLKSYTQQFTKETVGSRPHIELDCPKCPSKDVTYAQVQMRSADEGTTIFYNCSKCGNRWQED
ncbi:transcription factor S-II-domain-containing protein, partial [Aspergillus filifer]